MLSRYFDHIDINDLLQDYCEQTRELFEDDPDKIDRLFVGSIGEIQLDSHPRYDLIWAQCKFIMKFFFFNKERKKFYIFV